MLTGQELLTALTRTKRTVRVVALDGSHATLTATQAAQIVRDSVDYEGFGTKRRVGLIRRIGASARKPDPVWASCWRTMEAAVLPPAPEWFLGMRSSR